MTDAKLLQVLGLVFAFLGASLLSMDVFGRNKVHKFASYWLESFKKNKNNIASLLGIAIGIFAVLRIQEWKVPFINFIIPLMLKSPVISIFISTIFTLAVLQIVYGGSDSFRRIPKKVMAHYRAVGNPKGWETIFKQFLRFNYVVGTIFYLFFIAFPLLAYLITGLLPFWTIAVSIQLPVLITLTLIGVGYPIVESLLRLFGTVIRKDVKSTFSVIGKWGFVLLALGFLLQAIGIWIM
ncbi:hypothetical protein ACFLVW_02660 [Chloroflexota bacterium]